MDFDPDSLLSNLQNDSVDDDMDALLSELSSFEDSNIGKNIETSAPNSSVNSFSGGMQVPPKHSSVDPLDDLESLMQNLHTTPPKSSPQISHNPTTFTSPHPPRDELDDLMAELGTVSKPVVTQTNTQSRTPSTRKVSADHDELDSLMSELNLSSSNPSSNPPSNINTFASPSSTYSNISTNKGDELEDLMRELDSTPSVKPSQSMSPARTTIVQPNAQQSNSSINQRNIHAPQNSSNELDDLLTQLGPKSTPHRSVLQTNPTNNQRVPSANVPLQQQRNPIQSPAQNSNSHDDLDDLLNQLDTKPTPQSSGTIQRSQNDFSNTSQRTASPVQQSAQQRTAAPIQQRNPTSVPQPAQTSHDELDDLMMQLGSQSPTRPTPQQSQQRSAVPIQQRNPTSVPQPVQTSHDELDDLMMQLGSQPPTRPTPQQSQQRSAVPIQQRNPTSVPQPAQTSHDELDDLMMQLGSQPPTRPTPQQSRQPNTPPSRPQSNDELDNLLGQLSTSQQPQRNNQSASGYQPVRPIPAPNRQQPANNDLDSLFDAIGEQVSGIAGASSHSTCAFCQKQIFSETLQALGKTYHPEHFVCFTCHNPLGTNEFYEENGNPQCSNCYSKIFCPICALCNQAIPDRCLTAMNKKWHVDCFICNNCRQPFADGRFFEQHGMPYCKRCYETTFMTRCAGCNQMISGRIINAMNQQWHQECFNCTYCRRNLTGQPFYEREGKPYCEQHYLTASNAICAGCKQPVVGRCVDAFGKKYHPEHFTCSYCFNPLSGGNYTQQNGQPYCFECNANLF